MRPASAWKPELAGLDTPADWRVETSRAGTPTLKVGRMYLHSRYDPGAEAQRLIETAELNPERPVLVVGLGLGAHVIALIEAGYRVAVAEPDPRVAALALEGPCAGADFLLGVGDADSVAAAPGFSAFAAEMPQVLAHPPTERLHPGYAAAVTARATRAALADHRLNIAVVGPLYGGSLPIANYLVRAFESLGHRVLRVDNDHAWPLYQQVDQGLRHRHAAGQLTQMYGRFLAEWSYARVAEFDPEICIVLAQAPVGPDFPGRIAQNGIVSAFWFVENWRHMSYWREIAPRYDHFFHIQPGEFEGKLAEAGCRNHAFVQTGCDPELHRPVTLDDAERDAFDCDLSFAGAGYYNRLCLFRGLTDYKFKIWGVDWADRDLAPLVQGGERRFDSETFMKIVAGSRINLNLHSSTAHDGVDPNCDAINPRVFEIAAAGGFQLCDPCKGLEEHFDLEAETPGYRGLKELRARIDHFLGRPEERRAAAGRARERALAEHTYAHRAQQMLDILLDAHGKRIMKRGVRVQRTVGEVRERLGRGNPLSDWLQTLPADMLFTHDNINAALRPAMDSEAYPERVFHYLKEVREFAETLLKEPR